MDIVLNGRRRLTARETQILALVADGLTDREIAQSLWLSEHTVNHHLKSIYIKLGARSRAHATAVGFRAGVVT
jgi:DNA-binding CsgD family transcriptional regulator